ncbi:cobalt-precorrin-5B (C(1))-methyltransferase [Pararhizobium sp. IMCC21322]|uniref:cobalt-precorrin-5B (C(1))-methyltransferase n=1 Tax=Pararhizobium sp. IMCC21322 TaxID=3067903 RepID=UPI0027422009|nr:cobalt-precorrin-5B (C(1))-methyltransferase [Pararhizobium sp. IMCC21322]
MNTRKPTDRALRRGWTTGACATAATKAALSALFTGSFPDPVQITLPKGEMPLFPLCREHLDGDRSMASIIKDAGDDPDVTHGAEVIVTVYRGLPGSGISFKAGPGVGMVTKAGLPIAPGEPAINPVPRKLMREVVEALCVEFDQPTDITIEISVADGAELALKTWNPRLGIVGGLSILGTTGIVHPFSCAAWIHSIHRGVDVSRAAGLKHIAGSTGSTSETAVQALYDLPDIALMDMGDFAGGLLKYVRTHPVSRLTIAGGFAKLVKLAQGALDLHSGRSQVDFNWLAGRIEALGGSQELVENSRIANTAAEVLSLAQEDTRELAEALTLDVARAAERTAQTALDRGGVSSAVSVDILVVGREGEVLANTASGLGLNPEA